MAELRERKQDNKPAQPQQVSTASKESTSSKAKKGSWTFTLLTILLVFWLVVALTLSVSYVTTNTVTFGYKLPSWRKLLPVSTRFCRLLVSNNRVWRGWSWVADRDRREWTMDHPVHPKAVIQSSGFIFRAYSLRYFPTRHFAI
jgi:uncharacterized membrane protein YgcG